MNRKITCYDSIDSTNSEAERRILQKTAENGEVIIARRQTDGKGTHDRSFYSEGGLYMSVIYLRGFEECAVTAKTAVALARAVDSLYGTSCKIKWVNDVILNGKKLAGILCKRLLVGGEKHLIIGIGVNTNTRCFPEGLNAVSLSQALHKPVNDIELAEKIIEELESNNSFMEEYKNRSSILGREVTVTERNGNRVRGIAEHINDDGSLILNVQGERRVIFAGDAE